VARPRPSRILIVGATGGTGRQLVEQALERGLSVTAFVRAEAEPSIRMADRSPREFRVVWRSCSQGHQGPDADSAREQQSAGPPTTKGPQVALEALANLAETGAGNRIRTGDPQLGKAGCRTVNLPIRSQPLGVPRPRT
jgi:NAD(P)-dependent dehydrogenase (short-subunit alcohol dehydrogenase family)